MLCGQYLNQELLGFKTLEDDGAAQAVWSDFIITQYYFLSGAQHFLYCSFTGLLMSSYAR